jgi:hypothetical protein
MWERGDAYRVLVGKPEGRNHSEDPGVDGKDLQEVGWGGRGMDWISLAQSRNRGRAVVNAVMNRRVV